MASSFPTTTGVATGAFEARASAAGYVSMVGPFVALGLLGGWLALHRPGSGSWAAVALCAGIIALWVVWLRGFRVRIEDGVLEYRDGQYQKRRCQLAEIAWCDSQWVTVSSLGRNLNRLRLVVALRGGGDIRIPIKPFSVEDRVKMRELMGGPEENNERWSDVLRREALAGSVQQGA